ncbi:hypothetical protein C8R45DRAFT_1102840 [Mycena sanguinolenta]|nr:hypothetical protein C8R45DRAFT_1102840 [Mycena sanguinolenta]
MRVAHALAEGVENIVDTLEEDSASHHHRKYESERKAPAWGDPLPLNPTRLAPLESDARGTLPAPTLFACTDNIVSTATHHEGHRDGYVETHRLARGCIRVRKLIDSGDLPEWGLWQFEIPWGLFIRASPTCAELLRGVQEFVPPTIPRHLSMQQERECYDVIMWLKGFPEPPVEEINRWHDLFWNERRAASERPKNPPNDYEERWRAWNQKYPE